MDISIIIRTKNEERWIEPCLKAVFDQTFKNFEVILVDNNSTDKTVERAKKFPISKILNCKEFFPGKALNMGIDQSKGRFIVCLSGHCIPTNTMWLDNLYRNFESDTIAAVYGRQEPLSFTSPNDKRDLMIVFGPEKRIQYKDFFFHNANSMIRRDLLEKYPFDEKLTNIEDRAWAKKIISKGYAIVYEPEASVYHYHGIHHDGNKERCENVVRIMESLEEKYTTTNVTKISCYFVVGIIPIKETELSRADELLLKYSIDVAKKTNSINKVVVTANTQEICDLALSFGADNVILRDVFLSNEYIGLERVYSFTLDRLEELNMFPDLLVLLEPTFPFREENMIDTLVKRTIEESLDTIIPAIAEYNPTWQIQDDMSLKRLDDGLIPRKYKKPLMRGLKGLCCVTRPQFIRDEQIFGDNVVLFEINSIHASIEIGEKEKQLIPFKLLELLIDNINNYSK